MMMMKYYIIKIFKKYRAYSRLFNLVLNKYKEITNVILNFVRKILYSFTLAKLLSAIITCIIAAFCKYLYSGGIYIEWGDFFGNFLLGILSWTSNTCFNNLFSLYLDTKSFNLNIHQLLFGLKTHKIGDDINLGDFKPKLYNPMDMDIDDDNGDGDNSGKSLDKGKGVDLESHPNYYGDKNVQKTENTDDNSKLLDKEKDITPAMPQATEPPLSIWKKVFPGIDQADVFFPKRVNPGPGFNVPGGEVPIRDEICQHIDYNSHILNQFRKMDLETAIEQRNNNIKLIEMMNKKTGFAQNMLSKVPETPTTAYDIRLKATIMSDLEELNKNRIRAEARATLLNSRIEFIQIEVNKKNNE